MPCPAPQVLRNGTCQCVPPFGENGGECFLPAESAFLRGAGWVIALLAVIIIISAIINVVQRRRYVTRFQGHWNTAKKRIQATIALSSGMVQPLLQGNFEEVLDEKEPYMPYIRKGPCTAGSPTSKKMSSVLETVENEEKTIAEKAEISRKSLQLGHLHWFAVASMHFKSDHDFLVGVGLPLYYGFHALPLGTALLAIVAPYVGYWSEGLSVWDANLDSHASPGQLERVQKATQTALVFLLSCMLLHGWLQGFLHRKEALKFDRNMSTMQDFTLELKGLPKSFTNEKDLLDQLMKRFELEDSDIAGVSIGYNLTLPGLYDAVDEMMTGVLELVENTFQQKNKTLEDQLAEIFEHEDYGKRTQTLQRLMKEEKQLQGSGRAFVVFTSKEKHDKVHKVSCGFWLEAEVQVQEKPEVEALKKSMLQSGQLTDSVYVNGELLPVGTRIVAVKEGGLLEVGKTLKLERLVTIVSSRGEPPACMWTNLGTPGWIKTERIWKGIFWTCVTFLIILVCVLKPYGTFLLLPYSEVESSPSFLTCQLGGWIMGIANNILCTVMWVNAWGVGFSNWRRLDQVTLLFNMFISLMNTGFNMYNALEPMITRLQGESTQENRIHIEQQTGDLLYNILVPGWLFFGFLIGQLMGTLVPFALNSLLVEVIYVWQCLPKWLSCVLALLVPGNPNGGEAPLKVRQAEIIFEPGGLALAWDYSNIIITPALCLLTLYFPLGTTSAFPPRPFRIFPVMLLWVIFTFLFHRFVHLPLSKKQVHSSVQTDNMALRWWALPILVVAGALSVLSWRLRQLKAVFVVPAMVLAVILYLFGLQIVGVAQDEDVFDSIEEDISKVQKHLLFDWFNTNPVHVLKSWYMIEEVPYKCRAQCPFMYGKEDLLLEHYERSSKAASFRRAESGEVGKPLVGTKTSIFGRELTSSLSFHSVGET